MGTDERGRRYKGGERGRGKLSKRRRTNEVGGERSGGGGVGEWGVTGGSAGVNLGGAKRHREKKRRPKEKTTRAAAV